MSWGHTVDDIGAQSVTAWHNFASIEDTCAVLEPDMNAMALVEHRQLVRVASVDIASVATV